MPSETDVALVVEKINAARAQGDTCMGMAFGRTVDEWKDIFNAAAQALDMPVVEVAPLADGSQHGLMTHSGALLAAFVQAGVAPAIVLVDASGNDRVTNINYMNGLARFTESLTQNHRNAVYVQIVPGAQSADPVAFYCMNPKTPRAPGQPTYPV